MADRNRTLAVLGASGDLEADWATLWVHGDTAEECWCIVDSVPGPYLAGAPDPAARIVPSRWGHLEGKLKGDVIE